MINGKNVGLSCLGNDLVPNSRCLPRCVGREGEKPAEVRLNFILMLLLCVLNTVQILINIWPLGKTRNVKCLP